MYYITERLITSFLDNFWFLFFFILIFLSRKARTVAGVIFSKFFDSGEIKQKKTPSDNNSQNSSNLDISELVRNELIALSITESDNEQILKTKKNIEYVFEGIIKNNIEHFLDKNSIEDIEFQVEEAVEKSIKDSIKTKIQTDEYLSTLRNELRNELELSNIDHLQRHIESEYSSTRTTKALMTNIFIIVNFIYFISLALFLTNSNSNGVSQLANSIPTKLALVISFAYIGFGSFVVYMIKSCNSRSLTLIALREENIKRSSTIKIANEMITSETNEHHVALMKLLTSNVSLKEQQAKHPYEVFLNGVKDSNIMLKGGKFEIEKTSNKEKQ